MLYIYIYIYFFHIFKCRWPRAHTWFLLPRSSMLFCELWCNSGELSLVMGDAILTLIVGRAVDAIPGVLFVGVQSLGFRIAPTLLADQLSVMGKINWKVRGSRSFGAISASIQAAFFRWSFWNLFFDSWLTLETVAPRYWSEGPSGASFPRNASNNLEDLEVPWWSSTT